ncbi:type II toxin-antitoxin system Phd/YefM family antitoxin [Aminipila luticellarii]|uniref:Antitoxin n=1 Tax=Aminipila luticellarii TaxID=2507160 RepID=A0A410PT88_9FIRM|nr:type II toxin-antitoxin system Phd/YefM family antitoxin [Aminipila luticellarii]QAT42182.1 type II toxin-antitoxin system Phd/YefM family antitoxin [Aminipila luticellarii]
MLAVNYSTIRNNLKNYCDLVTDNCETVIVTRKDEKNVVMISLDEYNNMLENLFIMSDKVNYARLLESKEQFDKHQGVTKTTEELEALANE